MKRSLLATVLLLTITACGGSDSPTNPDGDENPLANGTLTARIDGENWSATVITPAITSVSGGVSAIGGGRLTQAIAFAWLDQGPGTYTIGSSSAIGFNASITQPNAQWVANSNTGSGTLVITTKTANRIVGTFNFTVIGGSAGETETRTITNGAFDITF